MTKFKDRRISALQRVKLDRRTRERYKKLERIKAKQSHNNIKVPKSILLTDKEMHEFKELRKNTKERNESFKNIEKVSVAAHVQDLNNCIEKCDLFIEVLDFRDIDGTRSIKSENLIRESGRTVYAFISFYSDTFEVDLSRLENTGIKIIRDVSVFTEKKNICIFGRAQCGKFTLSKQIEEIISGVSISIVKIPSKHVDMSVALRSAIDLDTIDSLILFKSIYQFINPALICDFYKIPNFETCEELCSLLGKKYSSYTQPRKCMEAGALQFIKDVKASRILWIRRDSLYTFKFIN